MGNVFNNVNDAAGVLAKAAAMTIADELQFTKSIAQADPSDYDGVNGYSAGATIYVSKPARFVPGSAFDMTSTLQDIKEEKVALTLDIISNVGVEVNSLEMATTVQLKSLIKRFIKPAAQTIAQDVESRMLIKAKNAVANQVGTAGSTVYDPDLVLSAREKMNKYLCPKDDLRRFLHESTAGRSAVGARKGLFQASDEIAKQYKQGYVGMADGFTWLENELLPSHTNGTQVVSGSATMSGTAAEGATTFGITGTSSGTLTAGTSFTIANVYAVHPITKVTQPFLQQFVVTALNTAVSTAYTAVAISPAPYTSTSGGLQNVSRIPTSGDAITLVSGALSTAYQTGLCFHKNAFRMVSVPLVMPTAVEYAAQETVEGITVSIVRAFDIVKRRMITRLDYLGGFVADRPEWACKTIS